MEMPGTDERHQMLPYRYGYCVVLDLDRPPVIAGSIGLGWNSIVRVDVVGRAIDRYYVGNNAVAQEPRFVPRFAGARGRGHPDWSIPRAFARLRAMSSYPGRKLYPKLVEPSGIEPLTS